MKIILASGSPRRRELLAQIGIPFEVRVSEADETVAETEPEQVVLELSRRKAAAVFNETAEPNNTKAEPCVVIGADTIVVCGGQILGKPYTAENAERMLRMLAGRSHRVYTGVTVLKAAADGGVESRSFTECTEVHFAEMTDREIRDYAATGEPLDKAGAYGIQGLFARYVTGISGDFYNVVGLPVAKLYQTLKEMGYEGI